MRLNDEGIKEIIRPWGDRNKFQEKFLNFSSKRLADNDNINDTVEVLKKRKVSAIEDNLEQNNLPDENLLSNSSLINSLEINKSTNSLISLSGNVESDQSKDCLPDDDSDSEDEILVDVNTETEWINRGEISFHL